MTSPVFSVVAGPNGAGKSTLVDAFLRQGLAFRPFVNPDEIALRLGGNEATRELRAGRETLRLTQELIQKKQNFTRETTLTSKEILRTMNRAVKAGFDVRLHFVSVENITISMGRVRHRVALGGHDIPVKAQERRFAKSLSNAVPAAWIASRSSFYSNGEEGHRLIAEVFDGELHVTTRDPPDWLRRIVMRFRAG